LRPFILFGLLLLSACAPELQRIGPPIDAPRLTETAFHTADGVDLPLRKWLPWQGAAQEKPTQDKPGEVKPAEVKPLGVILALHGFNDYSAGLELPGHGLARRGFAVYAYDQRGFGATPQHGVWPGSEQMIADLRTAAHLLREKYPGLPLYLLGESMGGAVVMAGAVEPDPPSADGLILVSPAIWGWQTQSGFNRAAIDLAVHAAPRMTVVPTGLRLKASSNRQALIALARDPLVIKETRVDTAYGLIDLMTRAYDAASKLTTPRYLVLYGGNEEILSKGAVASMLRQLPDLPPDRARIALYPKGYHLLLRDWEAPQVYDDIAAWIEHPEAPLPSGADQHRPFRQ
jgi:alpha-beta hydrolase superfamily lysophospholipase